MKIVRDLPTGVRRVEHTPIEMADGVRLSAKLWIPADAEDRPVPAVLEYIPYRKRDGTRVRDAQNHGYFAGHGFAAVRVDLRGSGESQGVLRDEYLQQELDDAVEVLRWIAAQPWCDGNIGMMGISWGGFNALQVAAMQPPELKAIITACSTDDRYADDVHYMGGCLLGDNLSWAGEMFSYNSLPPDPAIAGEEWRDRWMERLGGSGLWLREWLHHQHRDGYWEHGSICEDPAAIQVPVLAVSGWADGYSNAVFRLLRDLRVPTFGMIGPWSHMYPHLGEPGPAIGFLQLAVRWWDRWLRGTDNGVEEDPQLQVWMQDSVAPTTTYAHRPGRWIAEPVWPPSNPRARTWALTARGRLVPPGQPHTTGNLSITSPLSVGLFAGKWCSYPSAPDLPHDQRQEDGGALVFDSEPLEEPLEILGAPEVELRLSADRPVAMVAVRLSDIAADSKATRVTYGLLNLTHRDGHDQPAPLEPGQAYTVRVSLNDIAQSFPAGHRLRIAISTSYWPLAWPPPQPVRLVIDTTASRLTLPVRPPRPEDGGPLPQPESAPPIRREVLAAPHHNWRVIRDLASDVSTLHVVKDAGVVRYPALEDLEYGRKAEEWYTTVGDDFDSVRGETLHTRTLGRGPWRIRTVTRTVLASDAEYFHLHATLDAYEDERRVFSRDWNEQVPRNLV